MTEAHNGSQPRIGHPISQLQRLPGELYDPLECRPMFANVFHHILSRACLDLDGVSLLRSVLHGSRPSSLRSFDHDGVRSTVYFDPAAVAFMVRRAGNTSSPGASTL